MGDYRERKLSYDENDVILGHQQAGRAVYVEVNLDHIVHNLELMKACCKNQTAGLICVVKADAYGHGAVPVSRHLKAHGADRLAVATVAEGVELRKADIQGPIHVLGNAQDWEMCTCVQYGLIPTVTSSSSIEGMAQALAKFSHQIVGLHNTNQINEDPPHGTVHIKVDSGMSRNGCQPHQLPHLVQKCKELGVPLEGIFSHIADHEDPAFTNEQEDVFEACIEPFRKDGYVFHMSGSGAIIQGYGTQYDYIRPGISMFGVAGTVEHIEEFVAKGFRPVLSIKGVPTLVKKCPKGRKVGYGCTYTCGEDEWIATYPIGYADGLWRCLTGKGYVVRDKTGEKCPYVGRVSMDAITVSLPCEPEKGETFTIVTADFDPITSVMGMAGMVDTIPNEVLVHFTNRLPRVYVTDTSPCVSITPSLNVQFVSKDELQHTPLDIHTQMEDAYLNQTLNNNQNIECTTDKDS